MVGGTTTCGCTLLFIMNHSQPLLTILHHCYQTLIRIVYHQFPSSESYENTQEPTNSLYSASLPKCNLSFELYILKTSKINDFPISVNAFDSKTFVLFHYYPLLHCYQPSLTMNEPQQFVWWSVTDLCRLTRLLCPVVVGEVDANIASS